MNKTLDPKPLKVTLLSNPTHPLEVMWAVWEASRHNEAVPEPWEIATFLRDELTGVGHGFNKEFIEKYPYYFPDPFLKIDEYGTGNDHEGPGAKERRQVKEAREQFRTKFLDTVTKLFSEDIPVTEFATFVVSIEHMPVSLREQLVRHRIGTAQDPRLGSDIVPTTIDDAYWSQTSRVQNLQNFFDDGDYFVPEELQGKFVDTAYGKQDAVVAFKEGLCNIQAEYRRMIAAGIHIEDARQIVPLCYTHRISWQFNLKSLMHILSRRTCWVSQLGIWGRMIEGMISELSTKIDPIFRQIVNPPCIKGDTWRSCPFVNINLERIDGRDGVMAPCPLWLHHNGEEAVNYAHSLNDKFANPVWVSDDSEDVDMEQPAWFGQGGKSDQEGGVPFPGNWWAQTKPMAERMSDGRLRFAKFWDRDVDTGERLTKSEIGSVS